MTEFSKFNREAQFDLVADVICDQLESMDWGAESSETMADTLARHVVALIRGDAVLVHRSVSGTPEGEKA